MVVNLKNNINSGFIDRTATVTQYFSEVRKFEQLTQEQELALFDIIKNSESEKERDDAARKIAECNQRFVIAIAHHYASDEKFSDCVGEGTIGLMKAIKAFDPSKGVRFTTFAVHYIRRDITQYLRDDDPIIRKTNISKTFHIAAKAKNEFIQIEEREPTSQELLDFINEKYGLDIKDSADLSEIQMVSIDSPITDEEDDACMGDLQEFNSYSATENDYKKEEEKDYNMHILESLFTILTPREQTVIKMSFGIGYDHEYEPKEIAKELGLTAERIRQMKTSIIERLQNEMIKRTKENA